MAEYAKLLLNKIVEQGDVKALDRHNITADDMHSEVDRKTYEFIREYATKNSGQAPSYATVASEVEGFEYIPEVSDSFRWLADRLKDYSAQRAVVDWFKPKEDGQPGEFERKLNELGGKEFVNEWLPKALESVKIRTDVRETVGTNVKQDGEKFLAEYERRKAGKSFRVWKSKFPAIGEYVSSNLYTVFGKSGRGKSVISLEDAIHAAEQGANVLLWALEMGVYEILVRIYVSISGEVGVSHAQMHGLDLTAGFDSRDVLLGQLDEQFEQALYTFVNAINDHLDGNITIRAVDDEDFHDRSLSALEADIEATNADYVVIDPFYYLHYEKNTSRTTGGDAANTSMKLRAMAGRTSTVIVAITQADETKSEESEDGGRELALPNREDVKKTTQLLEDASLLIGVDTDYKQGRGLVGVSKGRSGGEGNETEILYIPQIGIVRAMDTGEAVAGQFDF